MKIYIVIYLNFINNQNRKKETLISKNTGKVNPAQDKIGYFTGCKNVLYALIINNTTNSI